MSGGRITLGLGTGWFEAEYQAIGIPFPPSSERFDRLEEQLEILTGLWRTPPGEKFSYDGRFYQMDGNPALPKPAQAAGPPIIIGGGGKKRTPAIAARFADEYNTPFSTPDAIPEQFGRIDAACEAVGRDPSTVVRSSTVAMCVGEDSSVVARRAAAIGRDPAELKTNGVCGTPDEAVERIGEYAAAGTTRLYLQLIDIRDLDHARLIGAEVLPRVR
jgi:alkanesulfonate monooxygenase